MKFGLVWVLGLALAVICLFGANSVTGNELEPRQDEGRFKVDLYTPWEKINYRLTKFIQNFKFFKFLDAFFWILNNCILASTSPEYISARENITSHILHHVRGHEDEINEAVINFNAGLICNMQWFAYVHNYVWVEDELKSMEDIFNFHRDHGLPKIYDVLRGIYIRGNCPQELIDTLPNGTTTVTKRHSPRQGAPTSANLREQMLHHKSTPFPIMMNDQCTLPNILKQIEGTGMLELAKLIDTYVREISQNPSIHFLFGKIQEPAKGWSFRGLRLKDEVRKILYCIDLTIRPLLDIVYDLLLALTGWLDLRKTNIFELVIGLLEGIFWNVYEPVPRFEGSPEMCLPPTSPPPPDTTTGTYF